MARQTLTLDDLGKKYGNDRQKDFPRGENRNSNNRNNRRGNNQRNSHSGNNLYHGTPQTVARQANIEKATAPYNFVSLPEKVLPSEIENVDAFKNHIQNFGNISGEIELEIETLTPIFLGGNAEKSFAPVGKFIIPGSSLRGMFKNIFKIVTCGTFRGRTDSQKKGEDFNDEHIYYRCLMGVRSLPWTRDLNREYNSRMVGTIRGADGQIKPAKNARPGFLIQTFDNKFFIAPSIYEYDRQEDRIFIKEYEQTYSTHIEIRNSSCVEWRGRNAYIITGSNNGFLHDKQSYARLTDDEKRRAGKQFIRFTSIDYVDWSKRIELPEEVRESYEHDRNRKGVNLFTDKGILKRSQLENLCKNLPADVKTLIPCHFLYEDNRVTAFGHGQCFRIPYKNAIGDIVPSNLKSTEVIDFADALFGMKENWASRVFFEDATPISEIETLETAAAHPLMQPNPTSYQLYLVQEENTLTHWDKTNATLRGYKLYWHNGEWDWKANENEIKEDKKRIEKKQDPLAKKLTPLKQGNKFKSKIRFQNLSTVELGALLMIFDLNGAENPAYKIGMGKSFGFGSIKITPQLFIENDDAYTAEIFDYEGFISPYNASETQGYINSFKKYLNAKIGLKAWKKVMDELNAILDWKNKPAPEKIKSMSGDVSGGSVDERFKQRAPLPNIFEVVK